MKNKIDNEIGITFEILNHKRSLTAALKTNMEKVEIIIIERPDMVKLLNKLA